MEKIKRKAFFTLCVAIVLFLGIMVFIYSARKVFLERANYSIYQAARETASEIETAVTHSNNTIKLLSAYVTTQMDGKELKDPRKVFADFNNKTLFNYVEYVRWDGINSMSGVPSEQPFDASNLEYYIEGIKGKSGLWVNFKPKREKEVLVEFYTPLYYEDEIVGVITGLMGGHTAFVPLLKADFFGEKLSAVLCDENYRVISSTENLIPYGIDLSEHSENSFMSKIIEHSEYDDTEPFQFKDDGKTGLSCVVNIPTTDWKLVMMVLPKALKKSMEPVTNRLYIFMTFVILVFISYLVVYIVYQRKTNRDIRSKHRESQKRVRQLEEMQTTQISILTSISGIYLTNHFIDLEKDMMVEIVANEEISKFVDVRQKPSEEMVKVMKQTVVPEYVDEALAFTNLHTIAKRLKGKKILSAEFVGNFHGWFRANFIPVECNDEGLPVKVLFLTQVIDKEKRWEQKLLSSANTDELTNLLNRHAYEMDIRELKGKALQKDFVYVSMDLNGLKTTNDNLGHEAGDELLKGASDCIYEVFNSYGKVYRTGGDEFQAIVYMNREELKRSSIWFDNLTKEWTGKLVDELSISIGFVRKDEVPDFSLSEIIKLADQRMYRSKSQYYISKGIDRRAQKVAFEVLCQSYSKILRVNMENDDFSIIYAESDELKGSKGYSERLSVWLNNFVKADCVHKDDVEDFLKKTDYKYIKESFAEGNKIIPVKYRKLDENTYKNNLMEIISAKDITSNENIIYIYVKSFEN